MNRITFLIFSLLLGYNLMAQNVVITDRETNDPIPHVQVFDSGRTIMATTDMEGNVDLGPFMKLDSIEFSHVSYLPKRVATINLTNGSKVKLETRTLMHEEFVVGASKFRERRDDIPQSIETISAKAIAFENSQTTADLLQNSPGIFVQKSQLGGGSPILRGFEANKVLLVVDGLRMNNAIYRSGHLQNVMSVDQGVLERAEVVQGPGSVVYGSEALGGVIHLQSKDPKLNTDFAKKMLVLGNTYSRYSTANNELTGHIDISVGWKKFGSLTSFSFSDFKDLRMGNVTNPFSDELPRDEFHVERVGDMDTMIVNEDRNIQDLSGYNQLDVLQKFIFKPSKKVTHRLNFQYSTTGDVPRYDRQQLLNGTNPKYAEWFYGPQNRLLASYSTSVAAHGKMFDYLKFVTGYQRIRESRITREFNADTRNTKVEDVDVIGMNLDLSKGVDKHLIRYGLELNFNNVGSSAENENIISGEKTASESRYPSGGTITFMGAAYLSHSWKITPLIRMQEGIRYNYNLLKADFGSLAILNYDDEEFTIQNNAINGSLGFVFTPAKGWNISVLGATGFRSPNLDDLGKGFELNNGNLQIPNPNLKATYLYSAELSLNKLWKNGSSVGLVGYYSYLTNAIVRSPVQYQGQDSVFYQGENLRTFANKNEQEAFVCGATFQFGAQMAGGLAFTGSATYTYGRIIGDSINTPLDHIPPLFGKLGLLYKHKRFRAEFYTHWSAWKRKSDYNMTGSDNFDTATSKGMPAWYTLNARVSYKLGKSMTVQLGLENMMDQNYRRYGSDISGAGRNFILALRATL